MHFLLQEINEGWNGTSNESRAQRARLVLLETSHEEVLAPLDVAGAVTSVALGT